MAIRVGRGKMQLTRFDEQFPKTLPQMQQISQISLTQAKLQEILPRISLLWQRVSVREKCDWQHLMAHQRKKPLSAQNLAKIFYASRVIVNFVPNFVATATGVGRGKMRLAAFDNPFSKTPYRRKNLARISYASRVITNFVPNFVAMATRVNRG